MSGLDNVTPTVTGVGSARKQIFNGRRPEGESGGGAFTNSNMQTPVQQSHSQQPFPAVFHANLQENFMANLSSGNHQSSPLNGASGSQSQHLPFPGGLIQNSGQSPQEFFVPPMAGVNPTICNTINANGFNPLVWAGMKSVRDEDIDTFLNDQWGSQMVLVAFSPSRRLAAASENDLYVRTLSEFPWRENGNVVFFCEGGKIVKTHAVLLHGILPNFTNEIIQMASSFPLSSSLPYIPICVKGIDQRCIEHLLNLIFRGADVLTGKEVHQLVQVMDVLSIHELSVCVVPGLGLGLNSCNAAATEGLGQPQMNVGTGSATSCVPTPVPPPETPPKKLQKSPKLIQPASSPAPLPTTATLPWSAPVPVTDLSDVVIKTEHVSPVMIKQEPVDYDQTQYKRTNGSNSNEVKVAPPRRKRKQAKATVPEPKQLTELSNPASATRTRKSITVKQEPVPIAPWLHAHPSMENLSSIPVTDPLGLVSNALLENGNSNPSPQDQETSNRPGLRRRIPQRKSKSDGQIKQQNLIENGSPSDGDDEDDTSGRAKRRRTVYPKGMKDGALAAITNGKSIKDVAADLDVSTKLISRWKYESKKFVSTPKSEDADTNSIPQSESVDGNSFLKTEDPDAISLTKFGDSDSRSKFDCARSPCPPSPPKFEFNSEINFQSSLAPVNDTDAFDSGVFAATDGTIETERDDKASILAASDDMFTVPNPDADLPSVDEMVP